MYRRCAVSGCLHSSHGATVRLLYEANGQEREAGTLRAERTSCTFACRARGTLNSPLRCPSTKMGVACRQLQERSGTSRTVLLLAASCCFLQRLSSERRQHRSTEANFTLHISRARGARIVDRQRHLFPPGQDLDTLGRIGPHGEQEDHRDLRFLHDGHGKMEDRPRTEL